MSCGRLYMLPCPIGEGDPYDVLPRSNRDVMASIDYFIVENTRTARRFLSRAAIGRPIEELEFAECNEHTLFAEKEQLLAPILAGRNGGIISEAGLPGVADPGADVVALAHRHSIEIIPLVGPSSIMLALMASGQNGQSFAFNGYLPVKPAERAGALRRFERRVVSEEQSQIFIEAPYRNDRWFADALAVLHAETLLTVAVDLTAPNQQVRSMSIEQWRRQPKPDINKRPAIFIIGKGLF